MSWQQLVGGFLAGSVIATVTTPVGVSGAVFLLPVQLDLLAVPSPQVTPTNLLFNIVAIPGSLIRYRRQGQFAGGLTRQLVVGTLPGVVLGAFIRVYLIPGKQAFKLLAAALLLPIGAFILLRPTPRSGAGTAAWLSPAVITALALVVGTVGGIYGIGGGSILGPILVGGGMSVAVVAPAALASTFITSVAGVATYAVLGLSRAGPIAPNWVLGLACGLGDLLGGYLGARLQPRLPERALRLLLGSLAVGLAVTYLSQAA